MLHNLHIKLAQKLCLAAIFAVGGLVMVFDILRTVYALRQSNPADLALARVWGIAEPYIAVIVAALPPLFTLINRPSADTSRRTYLDIDHTPQVDASSGMVSHPWESRHEDEHMNMLKREELELRELQKYAAK